MIKSKIKTDIVKNQIIPQAQDHFIPHLKYKHTDFIFS